MQLTCAQHCVHGNYELCIHKVPIFSSLNHSDLLQIATMIQHRVYEKGERIVTEGEEPDGVMIINQGNVKAYKYTPEGREQILYVFSEGDFFGEQYLYRNQKANFNVEALETVHICQFTRNDFQKFLYSYPEISMKIIAELGTRTAHMENAFQSIGIRNVDARIAMLLIEYGDKYGKYTEEGIQITLPLSREGMANYMGVARETLSRKLGQMENEGIIQSFNNKTILVKEQSLLKSMAGIIK